MLISSSLSIICAEVTLDSNNNYDGSNGTIFTPYETNDTTGTTYSLLTDISFQNAGTSGIPLALGCFKEAAGDLTFQGNNRSLTFLLINAGSNSGTVASTTAADKNLTFNNFSNLSILSCPSFTIAPNGKSALTSANSLSLIGNSRIVFSRNFSSESGGVISTKNFSLAETSHSAIFSNNQVFNGHEGGVIYATGTVTIENNSGSVSFVNNVAKGSGGAIFSLGNCSITNNSQVTFNGNSSQESAQTQGGAIYCTTAGTTLSLTGNQQLLFINNNALTKGGAISAAKVNISSGGPTLFENNTSGSIAGKGIGGAINIEPGGELALSATSGDIIFNNNQLVEGTSIRRNAINISDTAKVTSIRSSTGQSIYFYDPITNPGTTSITDILNLNLADTGSNIQYEGAIVFSGEKLSTVEKAIVENLISTIRQPAILARGDLVLRDGVTVTFNSLKQSSGSRILIDGGTTLSAKEENLSLNGLAVNISSLDGKNKATLKTETADKNISLSGTIQLVDAQDSFYENHKLKNATTYPLIEIIATGSNGTITFGALSALTLQEPEVHYGYQGNWQLSWADGVSSKVGSINWSRTGYNPNPERRSNLPSNSLWGNFIDIRSLGQLMETKSNGQPFERDLWLSGIANFFHRDSMPTRHGFRHISGGYALGLTAATPTADQLIFAFCQLFVRERDHVVGKNHGDTYGASLYFQHTEGLFDIANFLWGKATRTPWILSEMSKMIPLSFDARFSYLHTDNHMKTNYTKYPTVNGSWRNNAFCADLGANFPITISGPYFLKEVEPFVKIQYIYAHQKDFNERSAEGRAFNKSELINIEIPIGVKFEKDAKSEKGTYDLTLMYVVDAYRRNPECMTYLTASDAHWKAYGANLARQGFLARAANHVQINPYMEIFGQFAFEVRSSSRSYNVDLGSKFRF
ncbi:Polymorphic membrane protein F,Type V secretory pathway, adhesin AidA,chlamydial polymorphic outer membrane protein repeat,Autotransporter beta-domain [Chlamydia serpentis]|uniref:Polymorphic membrane protein F,Type V secretory pathway, adhesin AidA,chlamydial polymorphic outer membrane protein repeat,Autotransporter beta-domain n=2 Tax=Chlamydia serpentis TaxID=1967782 RepID=A0A2R8FAX2_9CHLA|nr:Polymorphic membrane protein F,Type V secretory pathway, adhesin AidA,chlamydial polymorphic outer membrane protein repeat,Autotransporter beta-domain [Chlamydia serpentis]